MSRRLRAATLLLLAALTGLAGAAIVGSQGQSAAELYGELRPVVVTGRSLKAERTITAKQARANLRVVRVPARFVPAGAVTTPAQAVGLRPIGQLPAGLYLTAALLKPPGAEDGADPGSAGPARLPVGRQAVEIAVSAASTSLLGGSRLVDVVVTSEAGPGARGRTYLAAHAVPLLEILPNPELDQSGRTGAVLALRRRQALHLIQAETYARDIRLLPHGPG